MAELIESYITYGENKKAIVFAINKAHSKDIVERFIREGINAIYIDSDTNKEDRELIVKEFKEGKYKILCNVNIFTEGFDCPDVEVVQLARPTKSLSLYLQQVGRCMRPFQGKEYGLILDNACLWETHGLISSDFEWSLSEPVKIKKGKSKVSKKNKKTAFEFVAHEMLGLELEEIEILTPSSDFNINNLLPYYTLISPWSIRSAYNSGAYEFEDIDIEGDLDVLENDEINPDFEINCDLIVISESNCFGIKDTLNDKLILEIEYDSIGKPDLFGRSIIEKDGLVGLFCCETRKIIVSSKYQTIEKLYTETKNLSLFNVSKNGFYGLICNDNFILNCEFEQILVDFDSLPYLFNALKDNQWLVYKETGQQLDLTNVKSKYSDVFNKNLIHIDNIFGILNDSGTYLEFPLIIQDFRTEHNFLLVKYFGQWSIWNSGFNFKIIESRFENLIFVSDKVIIGKINGKYGVISINNRVYLDFEYESIEQICSDVFLARKDGLWKIFEEDNLVLEDKKKQNVIRLYKNKITENKNIEWLDNVSYIICENNFWKIYQNKNVIIKQMSKKEAIKKFNSKKKLENTMSTNDLQINSLKSNSDSERDKFIKKEFIYIENETFDNSKKVRDLYKDLRVSNPFIKEIISKTYFNIDLSPNNKISDQFYDFVKKVIEFDKSTIK